MLNYSNIKNASDVILSFVLLVLFFPLGLLISILLYLIQGESPFFMQDRIGKLNRKFRIIKFRTMRSLKGPDGRLMPDMQRITSLGRFIRSSSLDELPQLVNILKGDMSFVGPRPLLPKYIPLYSSEQARRHEVKPGITGWAQVNGRNNISWADKFKLDIWYVDNYSVLIDLKIICMTLLKVISREGINSGKQSTMEPFLGNGSDFSNRVNSENN
jgi:undecaprenyl phosphate N,N'-diacetylbacillosamine 1-phosphate transferase